MFRTDRIAENLTILKKIGVTKERAKNLARLSWVTKEYIEYHVNKAVKIENQSIGLAVWRMEHKK